MKNNVVIPKDLIKDKYFECVDETKQSIQMCIHQQDLVQDSMSMESGGINPQQEKMYVIKSKEHCAEIGRKYAVLIHETKRATIMWGEFKHDYLLVCTYWRQHYQKLSNFVLSRTGNMEIASQLSGLKASMDNCAQNLQYHERLVMVNLEKIHLNMQSSDPLKFYYAWTAITLTWHHLYATHEIYVSNRCTLLEDWYLKHLYIVYLIRQKEAAEIRDLNSSIRKSMKLIDVQGNRIWEKINDLRACFLFNSFGSYFMDFINETKNLMLTMNDLIKEFYQSEEYFEKCSLLLNTALPSADLEDSPLHVPFERRTTSYQPYQRRPSLHLENQIEPALEGKSKLEVAGELSSIFQRYYRGNINFKPVFEDV
ncbi:hypothetical protein HNY73_006800 [Argiope bruennichi]|uniref:Uncharacterized protein n=1 Tax=Argiope bruennichi TaxID=94029 RepID=A0A8T0FBY8_ARGBR|nr:hypothetical protein HNY73_006800 [Argiope bruennichi]